MKVLRHQPARSRGDAMELRRIAAASLDRVIGLVRIRAERRAKLLIAEAAVERAIDGNRPVALGDDFKASVARRP